MNTTQLKAHLFDAGQSLNWARQAVEEGDTAATAESLTQAIANLEAARQVIAEPETNHGVTETQSQD